MIACVLCGQMVPLAMAMLCEPCRAPRRRSRAMAAGCQLRPHRAGARLFHRAPGHRRRMRALQLDNLATLNQRLARSLAV